MTRPILMSIRPEFADKILAGTKGVEFRKKPITVPAEVVVYRSGPSGQRGVVGAFRAPRVHYVTPRSIPRGLQTGISLTALVEYAGGWDGELWAIVVEGVERFRAPVPLSALGFDRPPQSWRYAPADWRERLGARGAA